MKQLLILIAALCATALLLVCADVDFNNPLDKKSSDYLFGNTDNEEEKLATNEDGLAAIFDSTRRDPSWQCRKEAPSITLEGPPTATIYSNNVGVLELQRLMGVGGDWTGVVKVSEVVFIEAKLTRGGGEEVPVPPNGMPAINSYPAQFVIVYTATQTACPERPVGVQQRGLTINEHKDVDNTPPSIDVRGALNTTVFQDVVYADSGARAFDGDGTPLSIINKVEVFRIVNGERREAGVYNNVPVTDFSRIEIPTADLREYVVVYTVIGSNGVSATAERNVTIIPPITGGPRPIFVLNTYTHRFNVPGGATVTFQHPDTAIASYGGQYVEKGLSRVYYVNRDGTEVDIPLSMVTTTNLNLIGASASVRYSVQASGSNYQSGDTTRTIHAFETDCESVIPPSIEFTDGAEALSLNASDGRWTTATTGYRVTSNNTAEEPQVAWTRRYLVHFGTLNPNNLNVGTHTVTYVGLGQCGGIAVRQRQVTVR